MGHLGGVIVCIPLSLSPLTTSDSYLCSVPSCLGLDSLQLFSPITMANRQTVDSAFIISPLQGHFASPAPSTINDWQFPLHYSPTAASLHRLTTPIKREMPPPILTTPPPFELERCHHQVPFPLPHHHRPSFGEAQDGIPRLPSLFSSLTGELPCLRAVGDRAPVCVPPCSMNLCPCQLLVEGGPSILGWGSLPVHRVHEISFTKIICYF
jgi:hypothetical protein